MADAAGSDEAVTWERRLADVVESILALAAKDDACPCLNGWVQDENWTGDGGQRSEANGLIPCGFCNPGGWGHDIDEPMPPPESYDVDGDTLRRLRSVWGQRHG